jgi:hypothetical protein
MRKILIILAATAISGSAMAGDLALRAPVVARAAVYNGNVNQDRDFVELRRKYGPTAECAAANGDASFSFIKHHIVRLR